MPSPTAVKPDTTESQPFFTPSTAAFHADMTASVVAVQAAAILPGMSASRRSDTQPPTVVPMIWPAWSPKNRPAAPPMAPPMAAPTGPAKAPTIAPSFAPANMPPIVPARPPTAFPVRWSFSRRVRESSVSES